MGNKMFEIRLMPITEAQKTDNWITISTDSQCGLGIYANRDLIDHHELQNAMISFHISVDEHEDGQHFTIPNRSGHLLMVFLERLVIDFSALILAGRIDTTEVQQETWPTSDNIEADFDEFYRRYKEGKDNAD